MRSKNRDRISSEIGAMATAASDFPRVDSMQCKTACCCGVFSPCYFDEKCLGCRSNGGLLCCEGTGYCGCAPQSTICKGSKQCCCLVSACQCPPGDDVPCMCALCGLTCYGAWKSGGAPRQQVMQRRGGAATHKAEAMPAAAAAMPIATLVNGGRLKVGLCKNRSKGQAKRFERPSHRSTFAPILPRNTDDPYQTTTPTTARSSPRHERRRC